MKRTCLRDGGLDSVRQFVYETLTINASIQTGIMIK